MFFTAGDHARIKIFSLPVPATPPTSSTDPALAASFLTPRELTASGAAASIQPLPRGRLLFTRSSLAAPNDAFVLRALDAPGTLAPAVEQLTRLADPALAGKRLDAGADFWFTGAEGRRVHGWTLKPPGFKEGEARKWPVLLLIHGGPEGAWEDQWSNRWNPNGERNSCM